MAKDVEIINKWVELRRSDIHGSGVFARRRIPEETQVFEYIGEKISKEESERRGIEQEERARKTGEGAVYIFELNDEYDLDGNVEGNVARFVNHSCENNCEACNEDDRIYIYTLEELPKGTELTFDYGYDLEHFMDHPCRCGAPGCVGYIVRKDLRRKLKKILRGREENARKRARKKKLARTARPSGDAATR